MCLLFLYLLWLELQHYAEWQWNERILSLPWLWGGTSPVPTECGACCQVLLGLFVGLREDASFPGLLTFYHKGHWILSSVLSVSIDMRCFSLIC